MAPKPGPRGWNDIQLALAAMAMTLTLGLWNVFAGPDLAHAKESANTPPTEPPPPATELPTVSGTPTPLPQIKILLGGVAPQLQVVQAQPSTRRAARGGGGGGGGGSGTVTTRSS